MFHLQLTFSVSYALIYYGYFTLHLARSHPHSLPIRTMSHILPSPASDKVSLSHSHSRCSHTVPSGRKGPTLAVCFCLPFLLCCVAHSDGTLFLCYMKPQKMNLEPFI